MDSVRVRLALAMSLALALAAVHGLKCAADACDSMPCNESVTEESCVDGEFRRNRSLCHCCDICIPYAGANEDCRGVVVPSGYPPTVVCRPPLVCVGDYCRETNTT